MFAIIVIYVVPLSELVGFNVTFPDPPSMLINDYSDYPSELHPMYSIPGEESFPQIRDTLKGLICEFCAFKLNE